MLVSDLVSEEKTSKLCLHAPQPCFAQVDGITDSMHNGMVKYAYFEARPQEYADLAVLHYDRANQLSSIKSRIRNI